MSQFQSTMRSRSAAAAPSTARLRIRSRNSIAMTLTVSRWIDAMSSTVAFESSARRCQIRRVGCGGLLAGGKKYLVGFVPRVVGGGVGRLVGATVATVFL